MKTAEEQALEFIEKNKWTHEDMNSDTFEDYTKEAFLAGHKAASERVVALENKLLLALHIITESSDAKTIMEQYGDTLRRIKEQS